MVGRAVQARPGHWRKERRGKPLHASSWPNLNTDNIRLCARRGRQIKAKGEIENTERIIRIAVETFASPFWIFVAITSHGWHSTCCLLRLAYHLTRAAESCQAGIASSFALLGWRVAHPGQIITPLSKNPANSNGICHVARGSTQLSNKRNGVEGCISANTELGQPTTSSEQHRQAVNARRHDE